MLQSSSEEKASSRRYALCVGIGTYSNLVNRNLRYAVADAEVIAKRLAVRGDFTVTCLTEPYQTTKATLEKAVEDLLSASERQAEDFIVLYFSCHGDVNKEENTFLLLPSNATHQVNGIFDQSTVINISDLARWFSRARTRNIVLFLDVCHSGGAGVALQHFKLHMNTDLNIFIIGAARQDRIAEQSSKLEHGIFTHCLLRAFVQPPTKDGWLTISQIQEFVSEDISWFSTKDHPLQIQVSSVYVNPLLPLVRNPGYPELSPLPPLWNIPLPRNPFFTEQDDIVSQLAKVLQREQKTALTQPYTLNGLGGVGKTQLALEYAYRHRQDYHAILWGRADTRENLISTFVNIAHLLNLPEKDENDQMVIVGAVKAWLMKRTHWLFILDNADELVLIKEFLPPAFGGHLLLTTRAQATSGIASNFEVESMQPETGALLLLHRSRLLAQDVSLEFATPSDVALAKEISSELGGLPLALDQAGAYLEQTRYGLVDYQKVYQDHRKRLLETRGGVRVAHPDPAEHPDPVATTWSISFDRVAQKNVLATQVLYLCAFLSADAIPQEMLTNGPDPLAENLWTLGEAIETLRAYSLVRPDPTTRTLSIHRLVQAVIRDALAPSEQAQEIERAIQTLNALFPDSTVTEWPECERLLSHILVAATYTSDETASMELVQCLRKAAMYLIGRAQYREAEPLLLRARRITEQQLDPDPYAYVIIFNGLALLYLRQGNHTQAEPLFEQALQIIEDQVGSNHSLKAVMLSNLGLVYFQQGKYAQAESLFEQALEIIEDQPESDDSLLETMLVSNLGLIYFQQGKYAQTEPLFQRAMQKLDHSEAFVHHDLVLVLGNLGTMYAQQDKYDEAESVLERALEISEQQLGSDHPNVALLSANLAQVYIGQGKYANAEALLQQALQINERRPDLEHTFSLASLITLANLLYQQDKYTEAESLLQRALQFCERRLDSNHPDIAVILQRLGNVYYQQGKYLEAEPLYQRALQIREQKLTPEHLQVASVLTNLANLYKAQQKYGQAEPLYQRALQIREQRLGPDDLEVVTSLNNLANFYYHQRYKKAKAEPLYQHVLQIREQKLNPDDLDIATSLNNLANFYYSEQILSIRAEPLYQRALQIREQKLGADHLDVAVILNNLASLYRDQGRFFEAEPLYQRALQIREQKLGHEHATTRKTRTDYANLKRLRGCRHVWYGFLVILSGISVIVWLYHKFDLWGWIALVIIILSNLFLAFGWYLYFSEKRKRKTKSKLSI